MHMMPTIDFHNLGKSLAISAPSIPFFCNSNLLPCPSKNPKGLIFFQKNLYDGCIIYCYKIEIHFFFQRFKWTNFQWWPWQFQLNNFSHLKPMNNLGIFVLLVNAMTIENYFYDKQASQPPTIPCSPLTSFINGCILLNNHFYKIRFLSNLKASNTSEINERFNINQ
jgi:hypothetical protein